MAWNIWGHSLPEMETWITSHGFPKFRAKQLQDYLYRRYIFSFDDMTQLPGPMREWLKENAILEKPVIMSHITSNDGDTTKLLVKLSDGSLVETVCMHHVYGNSICVSTQVGCAMGCIFCASTRNGLERNLTAGEILAQVYAFRELFDAPIHSIVLMGAGEPLTNYDEVLRFIRLVSDPGLLNISLRNITLSTCGIVPMIDKLAEKKLQLTLSISLHAPNDAMRSGMMPVNDAYPVAQLIAACRRYQQTTGRRVSFEYSMVRGVNDSPATAKELAALIRGMGAHVNLIPINPVDGSPYSATDAENVKRFQTLLTDLGVNATVRRRLGSDISAACGQLRREEAAREGRK